MKNSFVVYYDIDVFLDTLNDPDAGKLFKAMVKYASKGKLIELPDIVKGAFTLIKVFIDRDKRKYEERCEKNKQIVEKRWNSSANNNTKTNTRRYDRIQPYTNNTDNVNENVNENEIKLASNAFNKYLDAIYNHNVEQGNIPIRNIDAYKRKLEKELKPEFAEMSKLFKKLDEGQKLNDSKDHLVWTGGSALISSATEELSRHEAFRVKAAKKALTLISKEHTYEE